MEPKSVIIYIKNLPGIEHACPAIWHLSLVPEHSGTGLDPLIPDCMVPALGLFFVTVPIRPDAGLSGILAFKKLCEGVKGFTPARPHSWRL